MTPTNFEEQNGRAPVFRDVQEIMAQLRPPARFNEPILAIDQFEAARLLQGKGYPKHLHHATLPAVIALRKDQEMELRQLGYVDYYIPQVYPKMLFRRNFSPKFALQYDPATKEPMNIEYVEDRIVPTKEAHEKLMRERVPQTCGPWVEKLDEIEPMPEGPVEDPSVTIARLQGEVAALSGYAKPEEAEEPRKKRAYRRKEQTEEAPATA